MSLCLLAALLSPIQEPAAPASDRGIVTKTAAATPGFTLVAPLRSSSTYLLDIDGHTVHEWKSDLPPGNAVYLEDNGRLLRTERVDNETFRGGGQGGRIREMDWDGSVTWEYVLSDEKQCLHHDVKVLPNGHVLAIVWEMKSEDEVISVGRDPASSSDGLWVDAILEIEPVRPVGGKVVWEWHAFDHLVQSTDTKKPNHAGIGARPERLDINADIALRPSRADAARENDHLRGIGYVGGGEDDGGGLPPGPRGGMKDGDWTHANGIDWRADLDLIVLSSRTLSEVWVIDHSTTSAEAKTSTGGRYGHGGDLLFRYGNPRTFGATTAQEQKLFQQHDPQWIAPGLPGAGHLLVFNNGGPGREESSVDEIDLGLDAARLKKGFEAGALAAVKLAWTYTSPDIRSGHISGVQRLANGHTFVSAGEPGLLREVDAQGAVVWDLKSALTGNLGPMGGPGRGGPGRGGAGRGGPGRAGPDGGPGGDPARGGPPGGPDDPSASGAGGQPGPGGPGGRGGPRGAGPGGPGGGGPGSGGPSGRGGPGGGPDGPYSFFRADHYSADHPALARLAPRTGDAK